MFTIARMYDPEELRELIEVLADGKLDEYRAARRRFFPYRSAREVLAFADAYADRRARHERLMDEGLDWGGARAVLSDLLWDLQCGRKPDLAKHIRRRTQSPADIVWGTVASIAFAALLPSLAAYFFLTDPFAMFAVFVGAAIFGPLGVAVCWSALRFQWQPIPRFILWAELAANALIAAVPVFWIVVLITGVFTFSL